MLGRSVSRSVSVVKDRFSCHKTVNASTVGHTPIGQVDRVAGRSRPRALSLSTSEVTPATKPRTAAPAQTSGYVSAQQVTRRTRRWWSSDIRTTLGRQAYARRWSRSTLVRGNGGVSRKQRIFGCRGRRRGSAQVDAAVVSWSSSMSPSPCPCPYDVLVPVRTLSVWTGSVGRRRRGSFWTDAWRAPPSIPHPSR